MDTDIEVAEVESDIQDTIDIAELDDSALEDLLGAGGSPEADADTESQNEGKQGDTDDSKGESSQEATTNKDESTTTEKFAFIQDPELRKQVEEHVGDLSQQLEKALKQVTEKEQLFQRHTEEVGERRKYDIRELLKHNDPSQLGFSPEELNNLFYENPVQGMGTYLSRLAEKQAQVADSEAQSTELFRQVVPGIDDRETIEAIAELAKQYGNPQHEIDNFLRNPMQSNPAVIARLAWQVDLAKAENAHKAAIEQLKADHAAEIAKLKAGKETVVSRIQEAAKKKPQVRAGMGEAQSETDMNAPETELQIASLSDAELEARLKKLSL